jgi:hypothetical protein
MPDARNGAVLEVCSRVVAQTRPARICASHKSSMTSAVTIGKTFDVDMGRIRFDEPFFSTRNSQFRLIWPRPPPSPSYIVMAHLGLTTKQLYRVLCNWIYMIGETCRSVFGNGKKTRKLQVWNPHTLPLLLTRTFREGRYHCTRMDVNRDLKYKVSVPRSLCTRCNRASRELSNLQSMVHLTRNGVWLFQVIRSPHFYNQ